MQARLGSTRLPKKVLRQVTTGHTLLSLMLKRLSYLNNIQSHFNYKTVVAIPDNEENLELRSYLEDNNYEFFMGDENDLLSRHYHCAKFFGASIIIKIPSDCPLVCLDLITELTHILFQNKFDFVSNLNPSTFADGMDVEVMTEYTLSKAYHNATLIEDREHTTPYIWQNFDNVAVLRKENALDYTNYRLVVDYLDDLENLKRLLTKLNYVPLNYRELLLALKHSYPYNEHTNQSLKGNSWMSAGNYYVKEFDRVFYYEK